MDPLLIRLLGTFQVTLNQTDNQGFATEKARALLAYLVVEHKHAHTRDSLANLLWPEQGEDRARQNLRQALLHIRHALAEPDRYLDVNTQSIKVLSDRVRCDALHILDLAAECRTHRHRSNKQCYSCHNRKKEIAESYTGEFLQGFSINNSEPYEEWVLLTREHLHQIAVDAFTHLADFYELRGEIEKALFYARRLAELEPWREETHRQLMRLLVCDGQYSTALAQYKTCQRMMEKEFAAAPSNETTSLYQAIVQGNSTDCYSIVPPLRLPYGNSALIGRAVEVKEIAERMSNPDCRLLTLLGPGGTGKTSLAAHIAREFHGLFPDGVFFLSLVAIHTFDELALALLETLGINLPTSGNAASSLIQTIKSKNLLLVLDNFENLVAQSGFLSDLLSQAPAIQILVTSREQLRLREEWCYHVPGLSLPPLDTTEETTGNSDAVQLFEYRARQLDQRFNPTTDSLPAIHTICRLLEGSPLGIELSVVTAMERGPEVIAAELSQTLDSATAEYRNQPNRHRSLRAVFEQSWHLLTPSEQTHLAMLAVFPDSFSIESASAVASVQHTPLLNLAAKSLLREETPDRFNFHVVIHEFAREKLYQDTVNTRLIQHKHAAYFAVLCQQHRQSPIHFGKLFLERSNLIQAWHWCLRQNAPVDFSIDLLDGITDIHYRRGPLGEGIDLLKESIHVLQEKPTDFQALLLSAQFQLVSLLGTRGEFEEALHILNHIQTDQEIPLDKKRRYQLLYNKGRILAMQGESIEARPLLEEALLLAQEQNSQEDQSNCQRELGNVAMREGNSLIGREHYLQALGYYQQSGNQIGECSLTNNIGISYWDTGELDTAAEWLGKALRLYRSLKDLRGESKALINLSNVMADQGLLSESLYYLNAALKILKQIENRSGQGTAYNNLGSLYLYLGQYQAAENSYQKALEIYTENNNRQAEAEALGNLGLLASLQDKPDIAIERLQRAVRLSLECGDNSNASNALLFLARIEKTMGQFKQAEQHLKECHHLRRTIPHAAREMETKMETVHLYYLQGSPQQALSLLEPMLERLQTSSLPAGLEDPLRMYWLAYEILRGENDPRASIIIQEAQTHLQHLAERIKEPDLKTSFLEGFKTHRLIRSVHSK